MKTMIFALVCAAILGLSACGTVEGVGRDMKSAGEAISSTAQKVKSKN